MKKLFTSLVALGIGMVLNAQSFTGKVMEEKTGNPIEGATVQIGSRGAGVVTGSTGSFHIDDVKRASGTLTVKCIGYETRKISFTAEDTPVKISLSKAIVELSEVNIYDYRSDHSQMEVMKHPTKELASVSVSKTEVTAEQIEKQGAVTVVDAMKYVPSAWTETRGRKVKSFVSVRGQKYPYPEYSLNGVWQNEFEESGYFLSAVNVEGVEVIRSSAALLNSLSSLTGVINIKTKEYEKEETDVSLRYGSLNTQHASVAHGGKKNRLSYQGGFSYDGTEGPDNRHGKEQMGNAFVGLKYQFSDEWELKMDAMYFYGTRELVQPIAPADTKFNNWMESYDPIRSFISSAKLTWRPSDQSTTELSVNYADRNHVYKRYDISKESTSTSYEKDNELGINLIQALSLSKQNTLRFGVLYNHWEAPNGKRFYYGNACDVHTISGVVTDQHQFGKFLVEAGVRQISEYYKEYGAFNIEGSAGKFRGVAPIVEQWQPVRFQSTAGVNYQMDGANSFHFNFTGGQVNPRDGALTDAGEIPEQELRFNYELSAKHEFAKSGFISLAAFYTDRKEAIAYSGSTVELEEGDLMETYKNIDKKNAGIEFQVQTPQLWNLVHVYANATYMKAEDRVEGEWVEDPEVPNTIANLGLQFEQGAWDLNLYTNHVGEYTSTRFVSKDYIKENGPVSIGDFTTVDATLGYTFSQNKIRTFAQVKNIGDNEYQTVVGYPDYGRQWTIGIRASF